MNIRAFVKGSIAVVVDKRITGTLFVYNYVEVQRRKR